MSKALIVGAAGFVGSYLAREVKDHHGMEVHATKLAHEQLEIPGVAIHDLNILNKDEIVALPGLYFSSGGTEFGQCSMEESGAYD